MFDWEKINENEKLSEKQMQNNNIIILKKTGHAI